jgi:hypothetical protein
MTTSKDKYTYLKFKDIQSYKQAKRAATLFKEYFDADFTFRSIVVANFSKKIQFDLPEGAPPYKQLKEGADFRALWKVFKTQEIAMFVSDGKSKTASHFAKLETRFIQLLESIEENEAKLLIAMKDKKISELYPMITYDFVVMAVGEKALNEI